MPKKNQIEKLVLTGTDLPFLPRLTNKEIREALAIERFPEDKKAQRNFVKSSDKISLSPGEFLNLTKVRRLQDFLARLDRIELIADAVPHTSPNFRVAQVIKQRLAQADGQLKTENLTEFYAICVEIEFLCRKANNLVLVPYAKSERGRRHGAQRSRPRHDPLNNLIEEILKINSDLSALEILLKLKDYGEGILDDHLTPESNSISYYVSEETTALKTISIKTFRNRVSSIKKILTRRPI